MNFQKSALVPFDEFIKRSKNLIGEKSLNSKRNKLKRKYTSRFVLNQLAKKRRRGENLASVLQKNNVDYSNIFSEDQKPVIATIIQILGTRKDLISWNEKQELTINGNFLSGSNLAEILKCLTSKGKHYYISKSSEGDFPKGTKKLVNILKRIIDVPTEYDLFKTLRLNMKRFNELYGATRRPSSSVTRRTPSPTEILATTLNALRGRSPSPTSPPRSPTALSRTVSLSRSPSLNSDVGDSSPPVIYDPLMNQGMERDLDEMRDDVDQGLQDMTALDRENLNAAARPSTSGNLATPRNRIDKNTPQTIFATPPETTVKEQLARKTYPRSVQQIAKKLTYDEDSDSEETLFDRSKAQKTYGKKRTKTIAEQLFDAVPAPVSRIVRSVRKKVKSE